MFISHAVCGMPLRIVVQSCMYGWARKPRQRLQSERSSRSARHERLGTQLLPSTYSILRILCCLEFGVYKSVIFSQTRTTLSSEPDIICNLHTSSRATICLTLIHNLTEWFYHSSVLGVDRRSRHKHRENSIASGRSDPYLWYNNKTLRRVGNRFSQSVRKK